MADEFQICGENWWTSTPRNYSLNSSPCSSAALSHDIGSYGIWLTDHDLKTSSGSPSDQETACSTNQMVVVDSDTTLPMLGFGLSSSSVSMPISSTTTSSDQWSQALICSDGGGGGRSERNYDSILEEDLNSRLNFQQEMGVDLLQIQKDWGSKNFSTTSGEDSSITPFKQTTQAQQDFSIDQQQPQPDLNSAANGGGSTVDYNTTCQGLSTSFPMCSPQYGYAQPLLQGLFEPEPHPQPNIFDNRGISYTSSTTMPKHRTTNINNISSSHWINKFSSLAKPSLPKQVLVGSHLHFSNNTAFWNASATSLSDMRASSFPSQQSPLLAQAFEEKPNYQNFIAKPNNEDVRDIGSIVKKSSNNSNDEPVFKRPRIETPSPLPTFKVRKEKLGDRITALQQLVSPFGKTDTASVLHEAIEYIKFLHDQVNALCTPYITIQHPDPQALDKLKDAEGPEQDLRSRGLCLVPISSTYPVANETTADFWTPTFGGTFR
ncbi:hypothetical protein RJ641_018150 [Dillenia turbinata]|uniref:BHLH domain-containing protein n=1 Tax=Dillenia turbinata TaxID=194707 RepID=A0AAN8YW91_9MAGN